MTESHTVQLSRPHWAERLAVLGSALLLGVLVAVSAAYRADGWPLTGVWVLAAAITAVLVASRVAIVLGCLASALWLVAVRGWSNPVLVGGALLVWGSVARVWIRGGWAPQFQLRRIVAAGLTTIAIGAAFWIHQAWPWWYGDDVYLAATVNGYGPRRLRLEFKDAQVWLRGVAEPSQWAIDFFTPVTPLPGVWDTSKSWPEVARRLRGHPVFLQMERSGRLMPGGARVASAVSLSDSPVAGALNVAVRVVWIWPTHEGMLSLNFASAPMEPWLRGSVVPREGTKPASAVVQLKVLPSDQHAVRGHGSPVGAR